MSGKRVRRTQEQRTAETRVALFAAAVRVIDRMGYSAASNALIAEEAGISRGAITHHFATRNAFMAEVVKWVFVEESAIFHDLAHHSGNNPRVEEWPRLLWEVLSRPSGVAVLEILVASRSDPELATLTKPMQAEIERAGALNFLKRSTITAPDMAVIRLVVWTIRGLTMGRAFIAGPGEIKDAVALLSRMLAKAAPNGTLTELLTL